MRGEYLDKVNFHHHPTQILETVLFWAPLAPKDFFSMVVPDFPQSCPVGLAKVPKSSGFPLCLWSFSVKIPKNFVFLEFVGICLQREMFVNFLKNQELPTLGNFTDFWKENIFPRQISPSPPSKFRKQRRFRRLWRPKIFF